MDKDTDPEAREDEEEREELSKWTKFFRKYTTEEVKLLVSKVVQATLKVSLSNHIYQCCNDLYCQEREGGIGARVMGVVARVVIYAWADLLARNLEGIRVILYLLAKYIDVST